MRTVADLPPEVLKKIKKLAYDQFLEKHELYDYEYLINHHLNDLVFIEAAGYYVLTPHSGSDYERITFHRCNVSKNEHMIILFYTLDTNDGATVHLFAICERVPNEDIFVALVVHEVHDFMHTLLYEGKADTKIKNIQTEKNSLETVEEAKEIEKDRKKIIQLLKTPIIGAGPEDYKENNFEDIIYDETSKGKQG